VEEKWEYKTVVFGKRKFFTSQLNWEELNDQLNQHGNRGWELVSSIASSGPFFTGAVTVILERRKFDDNT